MLTASPSVQKTLFSSYQLNYIIFAGCKKGDRLNYKNSLSPLLLNLLSNLPYGAVMVFAINVTAVCANALPLSVAPVFIEISV